MKSTLDMLVGVALVGTGVYVGFVHGPNVMESAAKAVEHASVWTDYMPLYKSVLAMVAALALSAGGVSALLKGYSDSMKR